MRIMWGGWRRGSGGGTAHDVDSSWEVVGLLGRRGI